MYYIHKRLLKDLLVIEFQAVNDLEELKPMITKEKGALVRHDQY